MESSEHAGVRQSAGQREITEKVTPSSLLPGSSWSSGEIVLRITQRSRDQARGEGLAEVLTVQRGREAALSSDSQGNSESQMSELDRQTDRQTCSVRARALQSKGEGCAGDDRQVGESRDPRLLRITGKSRARSGKR